MRHRFEIRKKIMLTMAFMTIIPVLVMGIVSTAQSRNIIKEQTNTLARKNLIITAQEINEKVDLQRFRSCRQILSCFPACAVCRTPVRRIFPIRNSWKRSFTARGICCG